MSRSKIITLYTAYVLTNVVFFAYFLFPADAVKMHLMAFLRDKVPEMEISVDDLKPAFPPGLSLQKVGVHYQGHPVFDAEKLKLSLGIRSLLGKELGLGFTCRAYEGQAGGDVHFSMTQNGRFSAEVLLTDIQLQAMDVLKNFLPHDLSGKLNGSVTLTVDGPADQSAQANLRLTGAAIELAEPYFGIDQLSFNEIEAGLSLSNNRLTIDRFKTKGADVDGSLSGSLMLRSPLNASILNILGDVLPQPLLMDKIRQKLPLDALLKKTGKQNIAFRIDGTAASPKFSLR